MKIIGHLDTELGFRGGENQIRLLIELTNGKKFTETPGFENGCHHIMIGRPNSKITETMNNVCQTEVLDMRGGLDFLAAWHLKKLASRHHIDIIDAHTANAHSTALLAKVFGAKFSLVVHRRVDNVPKQGFLNRLKYLSPLISTYICISNAIKDVLSRYGVPASKTVVVKSAVSDNNYLGVDSKIKVEQKNRLAGELGVSSDKVWVVCAAAFTEQKGHMTLLRAWKRIDTNLRKSSVLLLAGDGVLLESSKTFVRENHLEDSVKFLGWVNDPSTLLISSDIYAMPSNWEGLGTVLLDASLACLPLCSSNVGGIPEIIESGHNGFLSEVGDDAVMAQNLAKLIESSDLRSKMGRHARDFALKYYSAEAMASGNIEVYSRVLLKAEERL